MADTFREKVRNFFENKTPDTRSSGACTKTRRRDAGSDDVPESQTATPEKLGRVVFLAGVQSAELAGERDLVVHLERAFLLVHVFKPNVETEEAELAHALEVDDEHLVGLTVGHAHGALRLEAQADERTVSQVSGGCSADLLLERRERLGSHGSVLRVEGSLRHQRAG